MQQGKYDGKSFNRCNSYDRLRIKHKIKEKRLKNMRKEKLITRSFEWAEVSILGFNTETSEAEVRKFTLNSKITENKKILEAVRKLNNDENFVPAKVDDIFIKSELRGMAESVFIANSHVIPNRFNANEVTE